MLSVVPLLTRPPNLNLPWKELTHDPAADYPNKRIEATGMRVLMVHDQHNRIQHLLFVNRCGAEPAGRFGPWGYQRLLAAVGSSFQSSLRNLFTRDEQELCRRRRCADAGHAEGTTKAPGFCSENQPPRSLADTTHLQRLQGHT